MRSLAWLALLPLLTECASLGGLGPDFRRPTVQFLSAELTEIDAKGATVSCRFEVANPNARELSVARVSWRVSVRGRPLAEGSLPEGARLPANGTAVVAVPARVLFGDLDSLLALAQSREDVPYELKGVAGVESPLGVIDLPFSHSGTLQRP
ncbi:MAG TPA: LEA type 2 family protein [Anaeromyxobacteraceae bacterium]|nr:LEA type 2 family protein [Anaeromyxobacteraceae bacterium]